MFVFEKLEQHVINKYKKARLILASLVLVSIVLFISLLLIIKNKTLSLIVLTILLSIESISIFIFVKYILLELKKRVKFILNKGKYLNTTLETTVNFIEKDKIFGINIYRYEINNKTYESYIKLEENTKYKLKISNKYIIDREEIYEELNNEN